MENKVFCEKRQSNTNGYKYDYHECGRVKGHLGKHRCGRNPKYCRFEWNTKDAVQKS